MTDTVDYGVSARRRQANSSSPQPDEPKALADYTHRIGAERRNFRRYVIKEQQRELYHYDRYIITIADGEVKIRDVQGKEIPEGLAPTELEQEAIHAACSGADWPTSTGINSIAELRAKLGREAILFEFRNEIDKGVIFVQQRIIDKDGGKIDLPWTYWSDGQWRCMEPDHEKLPLFGLEQLNQHWLATVFVHEGAKTAWFMSQPEFKKKEWWTARDVSEREWHDACPWAKELMGNRIEVAAHIGWPGGAPNPHRVDWEPLRRLPPHVRVIVVCDRDPPGEDAVSYISHAVQRRMQCVRFGDDFPRKFDLSDPFPEELYETKQNGVRV
jgi:hypothetical protein